MPKSPRARALVEDAHLLRALEREDSAAASQRILKSREQRTIGTSHQVRSRSEKELDGALTERGLERSPASNSQRSGSQTARSGARTARLSGLASPRFPRYKPEQGKGDVDESAARSSSHYRGAEASERYTAASVAYDVLKDLESSVRQLFEVRFGRTGGWEGA